MAWELRGKRRVYYRARRVSGSVKKEYCGCGLQAEHAAMADEAARKARDQEREQLRGIIKDAEPVTNLMKELDKAVRMLTAGSLLAAGYHQHRGNWRKRRGRASE